MGLKGEALGLLTKPAVTGLKKGGQQLLKIIAPELLEASAKTVKRLDFPNQGSWASSIMSLSDGTVNDLLKFSNSGDESITTVRKLLEAHAGGNVEPLMKFNATNTLHPEPAALPRKKGSLRQSKSQLVTDPTLTKAEKGATTKAFAETAIPANIGELTKLGTTLKKGQKRAASHHIFGLGDSADPILAHPSSEGVVPGTEPPIVAYAKQNFGTVSGEDTVNYVTALDNLTKGTRKSWVDQFSTILEGKIPQQVLNDIKGSSPRKGQSSVGMASSDPQASGQIQWRSEGRGKVSYDPHEYGGNIMRGEGTGAPATPLPGKNTYLIIRDPENGADIIRTMTGKTEDQAISPLDFQKHIRHVLNYYNKFKGANINVEEVLKQMRKIKMDPNLDIYGVDHAHIHAILPKAPMFKKIQKMMENGSWQKTSVSKAAELWHGLMKEQRTIAENMLQYRYDLIVDWYRKTNGGDFTELSIAEQTDYFLGNINDIAGLGGWARLPKLKQLIVPNPNLNREVLDALFNLKNLPQTAMSSFQDLVPKATPQPMTPEGF